ncbi:MAG: pyridoxal phosphate-dependent aminotransferase [Candidatus Sericytochromatia bacterium]|nr:pyridoxal phosphate-dependent aminotransferase [Candidatus Sericytochromatia bacterium]
MNPVFNQLAPSVIRAINAQKEPGDIDLGLGEPILPPDTRAFRDALRWVEDNGCPYTPNAGLPALRQAIAHRYGYPGLNQSENVCVTVGSQEAIFLAIKSVCAPGADEAIIVEPAYPAYAKICQMEGVPYRPVSLLPDNDFAPDAEKLLEAITPDTRLLILASPANPTGRVWREENYQALARGLYQIGDRRPYVLVDEVYRELCYVTPQPRSLASWYDRTLIAGSLSKSHSLTGLRLGWLLAPLDIQSAASKAHQFIVTAASTFSQQVALSIFQSAEPLDTTRAHYAGQRAILVKMLTQYGLKHIVPEGAFYALLAIPQTLGQNSYATALELLKRHRVVTIPGSAFGAEGWLRISWVTSPDNLATGLARIKEYFLHPET